VDVLPIFRNAGYAHAANAAVENARQRGAKYIALMNDDIKILHSHWLCEAVAHAERDPSLGIIGFAEATSDGRSSGVPEHALIDVEYLGNAGFAMMIPVELFDRIGMFDEVYYVIGEEVDLGARAQAAGYRTVKFGVPIYHFGGGTNETYKLLTAYLYMRNGIRFCLKNRSLIHAILRALRIIDLACNPWPLTFDNRDVPHRIMRNSGNLLVNLMLWLRAVLWNFLRLPQTLRIRAAEGRLSAAARAARQKSGLRLGKWSPN
jgi:GT2 family glycosyltransferase